jgi:hypothetical protein
MQTEKEEKEEMQKLTPRDLPDTTFGHTKLDVFNIHRHLAFVHEKHHLHFA